MSALSPTTPMARAEAALATIAASDRSEVWISRVPEAEVLAAARLVERRLAEGEVLPLAGLTLAVKDNIDVAGAPTTAGCPSYAFVPTVSAPVVARLVAAGAVVVGKTNLDQFATGLVGTRSPYGAVRNALDPAYASGGSSSGSGVAVALGQVDLALGTDTAGSGRVPAAFNGIVGYKPTRGRLSTSGVVPACRSIDCVTVFARTVAGACTAVGVAAGFDAADPFSRMAQPPGVAMGGRPRVGVPLAGQLDGMDLGYTAAFAAAVSRADALGWDLVPVDIGPYLAAGALLYDGALVAERFTAVGAFLATSPPDADPTVRDVIARAAQIPAHVLAADHERLAVLRRRFEPTWCTVDALLVPTAPRHPTLAEVASDPLGVNAQLGRFTNGCNLLDLAAIALPAGVVGPTGLPFGVSLLGPAWSDPGLAGLAATYLAEEPPAQPEAGLIELVVVGAHLTGQPLNGELTERGGRFVRAGRTAPVYRLFALDTVPPKPGLVRVAEGGVAIETEVWALPPAGFADFVTRVPGPLAIGQVELQSGTVTGFVCQPCGLDVATDISHHGGWRAYRASLGS